MKTKHHILRYVLIILLLFLVGCAAKDKKNKETVFSDFERWKKLAQYSEAHSPSPRKIDTQEYQKKSTAQHLTEAQTLKEQNKKIPQIVPERKLPSKRVTMQMHDVDVGVLFRSLAKAANVNIIINKSITGKASVNINGLPWSQVFKGLLDTYGYTYIWMGDIIRVMSIEDLKTQASLMDAKQMMEVKNKEYDIALMTLKTEKENLEPLKTRVVHVDYADPVQLRDNLWEYLKVSKNGYKKKSEKNEESDPGSIRGSIIVDNHTNSLMIQAISSDMIRILELMEKLDKPTSQVRIEAFIVETNGETARELGMQWGGLALSTAGKKNTWIGGSMGTPDTSLFDEDGSVITHLPIIGSISNFPSSDNAGNAGWKGTTLSLMTEKIGNFILYAQLTALQEEGKLNILSKPSITTLDNQKAIIESGRDIPYVSNNDGENTVEFKKAVLKLEATPHVIDGKNLKIKIITNKDELDFSNNVDGNPVILTKYAETEVILQDGQTTVIGGLGKETRSDTESGIPGIKDIPILGNAFKQKTNNVQMEHVLIFITPYILKERQQIHPDTVKKTDSDDSDDVNQLTQAQNEYRFSLQIGVFSNKTNVDRLLEKLREKGYHPYFYETRNSSDQPVYSVRIADFQDLKSALDAQEDYRKKEKKPAIVTFYDSLTSVPDRIRKF